MVLEFENTDPKPLMTFKQKLIIFLAVILTVILYFAPKVPSEKKQEAKEDSDFASQFEEAKKNLSSEQKIIFDRLEQGLKKAEEDN